MSYEEKGVWVYLVVAVAGYATYLAMLFTGAAGRPLPEADYVPAMLWTIGGAIVGAIVLRILIEIVWRSDNTRKDDRDRSIERVGDNVGNAFIVIGALGAMVLAMFSAPHFWIANVIYLGFVLSAILSSVTKIAAYRGSFQSW